MQMSVLVEISTALYLVLAAFTSTMRTTSLAARVSLRMSLPTLRNHFTANPRHVDTSNILLKAPNHSLLPPLSLFSGREWCNSFLLSTPTCFCSAYVLRVAPRPCLAEAARAARERKSQSRAPRAAASRASAVRKGAFCWQRSQRSLRKLRGA